MQIEQFLVGVRSLLPWPRLKRFDDGLRIDRAEAKVCNFYKNREFADQIMLDKDELDDYFGAEILEPVEEVNHYFRRQLRNMLDIRLADENEDDV